MQVKILINTTISHHYGHNGLTTCEYDRQIQSLFHKRIHIADNVMNAFSNVSNLLSILNYNVVISTLFNIRQWVFGNGLKHTLERVHRRWHYVRTFQPHIRDGNKVFRWEYLIYSVQRLILTEPTPFKSDYCSCLPDDKGNGRNLRRQ